MNTYESGLLSDHNTDAMFPECRSQILCFQNTDLKDSCVFESLRPDVVGVVHHEEYDSCVFTSHRPDVLGVAHHEESEFLCQRPVPRF